MTVTPELSTPAHPARPAGRWLVSGAVAFAAGITATGVAIAAAEHVHDLRKQQCEHLFERITAAMPGYALPLAAVGTVFVAVAAVLAVMGYRRAVGPLRLVAWLLTALAILGTLFALWFGVYAIHVDTPIEPPYCVG